jgi:adenylate kinase family enzyme
MLFWNVDKTIVSRDEFDRKLAEILQKDEWIVDGNYNRTLEARLKHCDTVFFLDFPKEVCLDGIKKRVGTKREDMPFVETQIDGELLRVVENFEKDSRPKIIELLQKNKSSDIRIFDSREEMSRFLQNISLT